MAGRALIIDKDAAFASRLEDALRRNGLEAETIATGREGIERAREASPELIVLCVELDDTSGYSICAKIKKDSSLQGIPLVITSEKATQETFDHHKKLKTRAQVYLMKPFEPDQLIEEVRPHVELAHGGPPPPPVEGEIEIEDVDVESADMPHDPGSPATIGDEAAFGDTGAELDEAIAELSEEPPPLPDELGIESNAALRQELDEDDVHTTIGVMPSSGIVAPNPHIASGSIDLPQPVLLRRLKEAERARDDAVASARATQAQLEALTAGASQLPASSSGSREVLSVKRELNAKERELLQLRDTLQERDRQLLDARDREAELEERVVQTEDARSEADRARVEAESRIAGAEARAEEIDRSSKATIAELDQQVEEARERIETLDRELAEARQHGEDLRAAVADRDATIEERDGALAARDGRINELETTLEERQAEITNLREDLEQAKEAIEGLTARGDGLDAELGETRNEVDALRGALGDTEERLNDAVQRIREDEDIRGKARQALEITLNLLGAADYGAVEAGPDHDSEPAPEDVVPLEEDAIPS